MSLESNIMDQRTVKKVKIVIVMVILLFLSYVGFNFSKNQDNTDLIWGTKEAPEESPSVEIKRKPDLNISKNKLLENYKVNSSSDNGTEIVSIYRLEDYTNTKAPIVELSFKESTEDVNQIIKKDLEDGKKELESNPPDLYKPELNSGEVSIGTDTWKYVDVPDYYDGGFKRKFLLNKAGYLFEFDLRDNLLLENSGKTQSEIFNIIASLRI